MLLLILSVKANLLDCYRWDQVSRRIMSGYMYFVYNAFLIPDFELNN